MSLKLVCQLEKMLEFQKITLLFSVLDWCMKLDESNQLWLWVLELGETYQLWLCALNGISSKDCFVFRIKEESSSEINFPVLDENDELNDAEQLLQLEGGYFTGTRQTHFM